MQKWLSPFLSPLLIYGLVELLHSGCAGLFHLFGDMAIDIQGESGGGVSKVFLDGFDIVTGLDAGNCIGVPQIMETGFWTTDFLSNFLERLID